MRLLVPPAVAAYDATRPPGTANPGGGMGVKYARAEEVLRQRYPDVRRVATLEAVDSESVLVDALWFVNDFEQKVNAFLERKFPFAVLYGSQENLLS